MWWAKKKKKRRGDGGFEGNESEGKVRGGERSRDLRGEGKKLGQWGGHGEV